MIFTVSKFSYSRPRDLAVLDKYSADIGKTVLSHYSWEICEYNKLRNLVPCGECGHRLSGHVEGGGTLWIIFNKIPPKITRGHPSGTGALQDKGRPNELQDGKGVPILIVVGKESWGVKALAVVSASLCKNFSSLHPSLLPHAGIPQCPFVLPDREGPAI